MTNSNPNQNPIAQAMGRVTNQNPVSPFIPARRDGVALPPPSYHFMYAPMSQRATPYLPEWTDNVGYMGNALKWARHLLPVGSSISGVRYKDRINQRTFLGPQAPVDIDTFVMTHREKARPNGTKVEIVLNLANGMVVVHLENEIQVYPDNYHRRARDMVAKYAPFYTHAGDVEWRQTLSVVTNIHTHDDLCPAMEKEWISSLHAVVESYWLALFPELPGTVIDDWSLLSKEQLEKYPAKPISPIHLKMFQDLQENVEKLETAEEIDKLKTQESVRLFYLQKLLTAMWHANQWMEPKWSYTWEQWRAQLSGDVHHPDSWEFLAPWPLIQSYLTSLCNSSDPKEYLR